MHPSGGRYRSHLFRVVRIDYASVSPASGSRRADRLATTRAGRRVVATVGFTRGWAPLTCGTAADRPRLSLPRQHRVFGVDVAGESKPVLPDIMGYCANP
jgi:hypothetical protein